MPPSIRHMTSHMALKPTVWDTPKMATDFTRSATCNDGRYPAPRPGDSRGPRPADSVPPQLTGARLTSSHGACGASLSRLLGALAIAALPIFSALACGGESTPDDELGPADEPLPPGVPTACSGKTFYVYGPYSELCQAGNVWFLCQGGSFSQVVCAPPQGWTQETTASDPFTASSGSTAADSASWPTDASRGADGTDGSTNFIGQKDDAGSALRDGGP